MVEASLVVEMWPDIQALRALLGTQTTKPLTEAVFVSDEGDWRLVAVLPGVEVTGTRPIYSALDAAAEEDGVDFSLLSRLVLLDADDRDAQSLTYATVSPSLPPRRLDSTLPSLPGFFGAVLQRDDRQERIRSGRRLEEEVASALRGQGLHADHETKLDIGWRPDFVVDLGSERRVFVEAVVADRRSVKTRIRDAAGMANVAGIPVILVMTGAVQANLDLQPSYGVVPVLPVDWQRQGPEGLREALAQAAGWLDQQSD